MEQRVKRVDDGATLPPTHTLGGDESARLQSSPAPGGDERIRVALIYGGTSGEHSISCATAGAVMAALDPKRYDVVSIGIRRDGTWVPGESDPSKLQLGGATTEVADSDERVIVPPGNGSSEWFAACDSEQGMQLRSLGHIDVAFPLLHGPFGEDGTIQGLFEMANIPYVGCGVFASAAGMDKHYMKIVLHDAGIPTTPSIAVTRQRWAVDRAGVLQDVASLGLPVYVKPARAGSSLGISRVDTISQLDLAMETAHKHDPKVLIEAEVRGREIECAVLGGHGVEPARAASPGEVVLEARNAQFYDFEHKYVDTEELRMQVPAHLDSEVTRRIQEMAVRAFDAFACEGLARVDFFLTESGELLVNEINTMPGFTPFSMYPVMWEKTGLPYRSLVDELITLALERGTGLR